MTSIMGALVSPDHIRCLLFVFDELFIVKEINTDLKKKRNCVSSDLYITGASRRTKGQPDTVKLG